MEVYKSSMFHRGVDSYWLLVDLLPGLQEKS